jgi:hypothetical protein
VRQSSSLSRLLSSTPPISRWPRLRYLFACLPVRSFASPYMLKLNCNRPDARKFGPRRHEPERFTDHNLLAYKIIKTFYV